MNIIFICLRTGVGAHEQRGQGVFYSYLFIYFCFITGHLPSQLKAAARAGGGDS